MNDETTEVSKELSSAIEKELDGKVEFKKQKLERQLTPLERSRKELWEKRQKIADKKSMDLGKHYTERFNEYLREYFDNFAPSKEENLVSYDILNKSWKKYANEANVSQKYVVLKCNSFEEEVTRIVKANDQFKENHPIAIPEDVIDLTNLKSE